MRRYVLSAKQYRTGHGREGWRGSPGSGTGRAAARRAGAGRAQPVAPAPVRLFAAPGPGRGRHAGRGGHALSAAPAAGGPGPAGQRVGHRDRAPAPLLPAQRRGQACPRGTRRGLARPGRGHRRFPGRRLMDVHDVIESYVRDVARYLSRDKRNDVALELRALLHDELAAKAGALGRRPDRAMAMELLAGFGRPAEVAARYQPRNPLIDPADNHNFLIWTVVGILALAVLGNHKPPEARWRAGMHGGGILFVVFALIGWGRRRQPAGRFSWRPHAQDMPVHGGRWAALASAVALCVFPLAMYLSPQGFWDTATLGKGVSGGLGLTNEFLGSWQRIATIGWLLLVIASYLAVVV